MPKICLQRERYSGRRGNLKENCCVKPGLRTVLCCELFLLATVTFFEALSLKHRTSEKKKSGMQKVFFLKNQGYPHVEIFRSRVWMSVHAPRRRRTSFPGLHLLPFLNFTVSPRARASHSSASMHGVVFSCWIFILQWDFGVEPIRAVKVLENDASTEPKRSHCNVNTQHLATSPGMLSHSRATLCML